MSGSLISTGTKEENRMKQEYTGLSNEELVAMFKAGDSWAFNVLMKNTEAIRFRLAHSYLNIPGSEIEDLMQEGAMEMSKLALRFDPTKGSSFTTVLYTDIKKLYADMFKAATAQRRNSGGMVLSYDQMNDNSEYEEEGDTLGNEIFSVECEEYSMIEIRETINKLTLSGKELISIQMLIDGKSKPEIAQLLNVKTPSVHTYIKRAGQKMKLSGAFA